MWTTGDCDPNKTKKATFRTHSSPWQRLQDRAKRFGTIPTSASQRSIRTNGPLTFAHGPVIIIYWAVQWSWFARVNALCNLSRKKSREAAASLPGRFLSRRCFTLCITMEVEPRIAKQYKCHHCCICKNYRGKGMEDGKQVSLRRFSADQKIASSWGEKIVFWGIL